MLPFYFDSMYIGRVKICNYPKSKEERAKDVEKYLHSKEYLFDEDNPLSKKLKDTKIFIKKNLFNGKVEKWDYYLQRFLMKNTK